MDQTSSRPNTSNASQQIVSIARSDRWQAHHRLQELGIACTCLADGRLQVEVNSPLSVVQVRSVLQQFTCSRQQLSNWLDHCWHLSAD